MPMRIVVKHKDESVYQFVSGVPAEFWTPNMAYLYGEAFLSGDQCLDGQHTAVEIWDGEVLYNTYTPEDFWNGEVLYNTYTPEDFPCAGT